MIDLLIECGGQNIDNSIPNLVSNVIRVFQIAIPIVLIILGMLDLGKAVTSNDEKQMKEAQKTLIKRLIYAVLIFFVVAIVKFVFGLVSNSGAEDNNGGTSATECIDSFVNGVG